ncbi:MAG: hypothetical protein E3J72_03230 [Planctomycetota bacterium]|nr:MAG: hypothetical protein E3J72_03230 [Planctomycetota bacterium]
MRFTITDFEAIHPVGNYPVPLYPTRKQAKKLGIDLYRIPEPVWKKFGRKALIGAVFLTLANSRCGTPGCVRQLPPGLQLVPKSERCLDEAEARQIILDRFAAEGVTFNEDMQYKVPFVEFEADGFDSYTEIGFEYTSREDAELYDALMDNGEWGEYNRLSLSNYELSTLYYNMMVGSHAVKNFKSGSKQTLTEERDYLIEQVEEFINWLKAHGKL